MQIKCQNLSFSYPNDVQALKGVSLQIESGEAVALVGENGAGKSTLVKHFNGLLKPTEGNVWVGEEDTQGRSTAQLARLVGYVFQNPDDQLFAQTVQAEVSFGPQNLGLSPDEIKDRVTQALSWVGIGHLSEKHPYDLLPTQRKLVIIAAILAMQTPVVILDEPTTGQDTQGIARIGEIINKLKNEKKTVIVISHDLDFCADHFDRTIVMAQAEVLIDGPSSEVLYSDDILSKASVDAPQIVRLAQALGYPEQPLNVEQFIESYAKKRGEK